MKRTIVHIDEDKCNGCGLCVPACEEGAIKIIDGKAKLIADKYCDGLGNCLGECPQDAITLIEREAEAFDQESVEAHLASGQSGCPGTQVRFSGLNQWPVQLKLLPPQAPFFRNADLLFAADCTAYALNGFHQQLLAGKALAICCPKLDDTSDYVDRICEIITRNQIQSITAAIMEVPCCSGLVRMIQLAIQQSGKDIPFSVQVVDINGRLKEVVA